MARDKNRLSVSALFAPRGQAGLRRRPQAGARRLPAFDSCREVQNASRFIFLKLPFQTAGLSTVWTTPAFEALLRLLDFLSAV